MAPCDADDARAAQPGGARAPAEADAPRNVLLRRRSVQRPCARGGAQEWTAWQTAAHALTPAQLSARTHMENWGDAEPASLAEIFAAADRGGKGFITETEYLHIVQRWYGSTDHWCELNAYSLP